MSSAPSATSGLFGFFTNRRINTKVMLGFALVLALTAVLAVMSYRGFSKVSDGFQAFNQRVGVVGMAREIERGFVGYRRLVREYSLTGSEAEMQEAKKRQAVLAQAIQQALAETKNPERHHKLVELD